MELAARTMRMNLHTLSKLGYILTFGVFLILFGITVLIGILGPAPWVYYPKEYTATANSVPVNAQWLTGLNVTKLNQRINVYAALPVNKKSAVNYQSYTLTFNSTISGLRSGASNYTVIAQTSQVRNVICYTSKDFCDAVVVVNVPYADYASYTFNLTCWDGLGKGFSSINYYFEVMDANFTQFELWFRFFFLVATVVVIILYAVKLRGFEWKDWAIEQRWVACLLFGLLGYNNPSFPLTVLLDGAIWPFLDQCLLASFLVLLMFFWIIMFDGIRTEPQLQTMRTFYLPKLLMLALFWIAAVVIFTWTELSQIRNPGVDVYSEPAYLVFYVIMILLLVIYILWLTYVVIRAISSRNAMPYLSLRLKFFGIFTLLVLIVVIAGVIFGQIGPVANNAAQLLSYISLLNLYVYTLAFVYFPSKDVIGRAKNSGMVTIQDLDESATAEMETGHASKSGFAPSSQPSSGMQPSSSFGGGFGGFGGGGFGGFNSSNSSSNVPANAPLTSTPAAGASTPGWRGSVNEQASSGPAPIRINFDDLDDEEAAL